MNSSVQNVVRNIGILNRFTDNHEIHEIYFDIACMQEGGWIYRLSDSPYHKEMLYCYNIISKCSFYYTRRRLIIHNNTQNDTE